MVCCCTDPRCSRLWLVGGLLAALAALADEAPGPAPPCNEPLCYTASHLEAERNRLVLYDIDIVDTTRGTSRILADRAEATGLDLASSVWVLTGHVQAFMPEGHLQADRATVQFANKRIETMTAQGAPAQFEHALDNGQIAHGHANEIVFDMQRNELQLSGEGWLTDGCNEISSSHITYDINAQRVQADSPPGGGARVHGTIRTGVAANQCTATKGRP